MAWLYRSLGSRLAWLALLSLWVGVAAAQQEFPGADGAPRFRPLIPGLGGDPGGDPVTFSGAYRLVPGTRDGVISVKAAIPPDWHL